MSQRVMHRDSDELAETSADPAIFRTPKSQSESEETWFRENLNLKNCTKFVLRDPDSSLKEKRSYLCACGRQFDHHFPQRVREEPDLSGEGEWNVKDNTTEYKTNAFGEIVFAGHSQNTAKYARLSVDTSMKTVIDLMMNQWNMKDPNFVVIILGGERNVDQKFRVNELFSQGLMKACSSKFTRGWIITGGAYTGVMDSVRDALAMNMIRPTMVGVAPWGNVAGRYKLTDREGKGRWPAKHAIVPKPQKFEYSLDMNHSHFLLVDDGTIRQGVQGIGEFRLRFIRALRTRFGPTVPFVCVVFKGGISSIKTVEEAIIKSSRGDPMSPPTKTSSVIVKHSGKAADILAFAYEKRPLKDTDPHAYENEIKPKLYNMIKEAFPTEDTIKVFVAVDNCVSNRDMISIFDPAKVDVEAQLDRLILNAPIKAGSFGDKKLKLALEWNRIDMAKTILNKTEDKIEPGEFSALCDLALIQNRPKFIELYQNNGFDISDYLTREKLKYLYFETTRSASNVLSMLKYLTTDYYVTDVILGCLKHSGQFFCCGKDKTDENREYNLDDIGRLIGRLIGNKYGKFYRENESKGSERTTTSEDVIIDYGVSESSTPDFEEPARDLFIWAILNDRLDVAKFFWKKQQNPIAAALTAVNLFKGMAKQGAFDQSTKDRFCAQAVEYEKYALEVLDACFESQLQATIAGDEPIEQKAEWLLIRSQKRFGDATSLQMAVDGECMNFISHASVQRLLDRMWRGKMLVDNEWWRISMCVLIPIPIFVYSLIYFYEDENAYTAKPHQEQPQHKGIIHGKTENVFDHQDLGRNLSIAERMKYFLRAPITVFSYNVISHLTFLSLFSYIVLSNYRENIDIAEKILAAWIVTLVIEEIRQCCRTGWQYFRQQENLADITALVTFFAALIMRSFGNTLEGARYLMCLSLILFFGRLLHIFSVYKQLGPMLIMIKQMVVDLTYFTFFIAVFFCAYGIAWHAILYPNSPVEFNLVFAVLRASYWSMHGEIETFLEEIETGKCTMNNVTGQLNHCEARQMLTPPLMGLYILFINVLMFNLLIALFSYRFGEMYPNAYKHWCLQRHSLILEYRTRPVLPPPLIFIVHILELLHLILKLLLRCACKCDTRARKDILEYVWPWNRETKIVFSDKETHKEKELAHWESLNAEIRFIQKEEESETTIESVEEKVRKISLKLDNLVKKIKSHDLDGQLGSIIDHWRRRVAASRLRQTQPSEIGQPRVDGQSQNTLRRRSKVEVVQASKDQPGVSAEQPENGAGTASQQRPIKTTTPANASYEPNDQPGVSAEQPQNREGTASQQRPIKTTTPANASNEFHDEVPVLENEKTQKRQRRLKKRKNEFVDDTETTKSTTDTDTSIQRR